MIDAVNTVFNSLMKIYPESEATISTTNGVMNRGKFVSGGEGGLNVIGVEDPGPRLGNLQRKREAAN